MNMNLESRRVPMPLVELVAGTRVIVGIGLGLLLAGRLTPQHRRTVGWTLFTLGGLSTIPLLAAIFSDGSSRGTDALQVRRNPISPYVSAEGAGEEHEIHAHA